MYGINLTTYPIMARLQLPLHYATALPSKPKEATSMGKVDFNTIRPSNWQKGGFTMVHFPWD